MLNISQNETSLIPSEDETKYYVDIDSEAKEKMVYRVWDNVAKTYIKSGTDVRIFLMKHWAQRLCDNANKYWPGRYELKTFMLTEVDE